MPPSMPPGVKRVVKRKADGTSTEYFYHRASGVKLPAPDDKGFSAALKAANKRGLKPAAGSEIRDLVSDYFRSMEFDRLAYETKRQRRWALGKFEGFELERLSSIKRGRVLDMREAIAAAHGNARANVFLVSVSSLCSWAVERERMETNPCFRINRLPVGEWEPWSDAEIDRALSVMREPMRRVILLAVHTGQRRSDLLAMTWNQVAGGTIRLTQQKTGKPLVLPIGPELAKHLAAWREARTSTHILTNARGRPWLPHAFSSAFTREMAAAGLAGRSLHGLRKVAAKRLAEAGCSVHEIAAITGHATLQMVAHYTKAADQQRMAEAAILKLETARGNRRKKTS